MNAHKKQELNGKIFILENRELYRRFLKNWLDGDGGDRVTFFHSMKDLQQSAEPRDLDLMAAHLLSGSFGRVRNGHRNGHAIYGEALDRPTILWCRKIGFTGIFDMGDGILDWEECLQKARNGEKAETASVRQELQEQGCAGLRRLSRREIEVARTLVKGLSVKQVAKKLGTAEGTVKNQRKSVYRKLGIVRATQLAGALGFGARKRTGPRG